MVKLVESTLRRGTVRAAFQCKSKPKRIRADRPEGAETTVPVMHLGGAAAAAVRSGSPAAK